MKNGKLGTAMGGYLLMVRVQVSAHLEARRGKDDLADAARFLGFHPTHVELAFSGWMD